MAADILDLAAPEWVASYTSETACESNFLVAFIAVHRLAGLGLELVLLVDRDLVKRFIRISYRWTQMLGHSANLITEIPTATAGLNAPPEMFPTAKSPHITVKPMASP